MSLGLVAAFVVGIGTLLIDVGRTYPRRTEPIVTGIAMSATAGIGFAHGNLLPVAAVAAPTLVAYLGWSALNRFPIFVLSLLAIRPCLDQFHGSATSSGPAASLAGLAILGVGVPWLAIRWSRSTGPRPNAFALGYSAFAVAGLLSLVSAPHRAEAAGEWLRISAVAVMLLVLSYIISDRDRARSVITVVYLSSVVPLLVALGQAAKHGVSTDSEGIARVKGTFTQANNLGLFLAMLCIFACGLLPHVRGRARMALVAWLGLGGSVLVMTLSRSAWAATLAGLLLIGVLQARRAIIVGALVMIAAVLVVAPVRDRITNLGNERSATGGAGNSLVWRLDHWKETGPLIERNPVTGVGLKMIPVLIDDSKVAHNDYLRALVETGVVGFVCYLLVLVGLFRVARAAALERRGTEGWSVGAAVGLLGTAVGFAVFAIGGNAISQGVTLWALGALVAATRAATWAPDGGRSGPEAQPATQPEEVAAAL
jgi:putative inorganic carbon (HCO3(-)) transporter